MACDCSQLVFNVIFIKFVYSEPVWAGVMVGVKLFPRF